MLASLSRVARAPFARRAAVRTLPRARSASSLVQYAYDGGIRTSNGDGWFGARHLSNGITSAPAADEQAGSPAVETGEGSELMHRVVEWINDERATEIIAFDVKHVSGGAVGNHLVFATANTKAHMRTISKAVVFELKERGVRVFGTTPTIEGTDSEEWMLVDGGDVS